MPLHGLVPGYWKALSFPFKMPSWHLSPFWHTSSEISDLFHPSVICFSATFPGGIRRGQHLDTFPLTVPQFIKCFKLRACMGSKIFLTCYFLNIFLTIIMTMKELHNMLCHRCLKCLHWNWDKHLQIQAHTNNWALYWLSLNLHFLCLFLASCHHMGNWGAGFKNQPLIQESGMQIMVFTQFLYLCKLNMNQQCDTANLILRCINRSMFFKSCVILVWCYSSRVLCPVLDTTL